MSVQVVHEVRSKQDCVNRFIEPHDFIHQRAVDELAEPVLAIVHCDDIALGGRAGERLEANAIG